MGRFDHLVTSKEIDTKEVQGNNTENVSEKAEQQKLQTKIEALKGFLNVNESLKENSSVKVLLQELNENLSMMENPAFSESFTTLVKKNITEITVYLDKYIQNLPNILGTLVQDSAQGNLGKNSQTPLGGDISMGKKETISNNDINKSGELKTKVIERLDIYLSYLAIKDGDNSELVSLINNYKDYLNEEYSSFRGESELIFSDINDSISVVTEKQSVEAHLLNKSKEALKNLSSTLDERIKKGNNNSIKNAVEIFGDDTIFPELLNYFNAHSLKDAMDKVDDIESYNDPEDVQKVIEIGEKINVSDVWFFEEKRTNTLDALENDWDDGKDVSREKLVQDLGLETKDSFLNLFNVLKSQLNNKEKVIDLGDKGIIPFESVLEKEKALVSTMLFLNALLDTPVTKVGYLTDMLTNLTDDGIDLTNAGLLDDIFVDGLGWGMTGEMISGAIGGVIILSLLAKRNPVAIISARREIIPGVNKSKEQIATEKYYYLSEEERATFLSQNNNEKLIDLSIVEEVPNRKKVLDYLVDKHGVDSSIGKKIQIFEEKYLFMGGDSKIFYRLLNDIENYGDMKADIKGIEVDYGNTYKNLSRINQLVRFAEYKWKNIRNPEANLTREQYLERANKSFINKLGKLNVDRSADLMKLFEDEFGNKPSSEKISSISEKAQNIHDKISNVLDKLSNTKTDTSAFETDIKTKLNEAIDKALSGSGNFDIKIDDIISTAENLSDDIDEKLSFAKDIKGVDKRIDILSISDQQRTNLKTLVSDAYKIDSEIDLDNVKKIIDSIKPLLEAGNNNKLSNELQKSITDKLSSLLDNSTVLDTLDDGLRELQGEIDVLLGKNGKISLLDKLANLSDEVQKSAYSKIEEGIKDDRDVKINNINESVDNIIKIEGTVRQNVSLDFAKNVVNKQLKDLLGLPAGDFDVLNNRLLKLAGLLDKVDSDFNSLLKKSISGQQIDWSVMARVEQFMDNLSRDQRFKQDKTPKGKTPQYAEVERLTAKIEFLEGEGENVDNLKTKLSDLRKAKGLPDVTPTPQPGPDVVDTNRTRLKDIIKDSDTLSGRRDMANGKTSLLIKLSSGEEKRIQFDLQASNIDTIFNKLESISTKGDLNKLLKVSGVTERFIKPRANPALKNLLAKIDGQRDQAMDLVDRAKIELQLANIQDPNNSLDTLVASQVDAMVLNKQEIDITAFNTLIGNRMQALGVFPIRDRKELLVDFAKTYDKIDATRLAELQKLIASGNLKDIRTKFKGFQFMSLLGKSVTKI